MLLTSVSWNSSPGERPRVSQACPLTATACTVAPMAPTCPMAASDGQRPGRSGEAGPGVWRSERDPASPPPHLGADPLGRSLCAWSRGGVSTEGSPGQPPSLSPEAFSGPAGFSRFPRWTAPSSPRQGPQAGAAFPPGPACEAGGPLHGDRVPRGPARKRGDNMTRRGHSPRLGCQGLGETTHETAVLTGHTPGPRAELGPSRCG